MKVAVTGGNGFLGRALITCLLECGHDVSVFTRNPKGTCEQESIKYFKYSKDGVSELYDHGEVDVLVLLAGAYQHGGENCSDLEYVNYSFPQAFISLFGGRVKRVVNIGTALPAAVNEYARTKNLFSDWFTSAACEGIETRINVQLHTMYGEGDSEARLFGYLLNRCLAGLDVPLSSGLQVRDFIYFRDVAYAISMLVSARVGKNCTFACGCGKGFTVRQFAEIVKEITGSKSQLCFGDKPMRPNEPMQLVANIDPISSIGWVPSLSLREGIALSVNRHLVGERNLTMEVR